MTQKLTEEEYMRAIDHLVEKGLRLPHNVFPGAVPGGVRHLNTRALWNAHPWNPEPRDMGASPKPTWSVIVAEGSAAVLDIRKLRMVASLRQEARRRISRAYGGTDWLGEMHRRLRGEATPEQDAERDRLRAVCKTVEARIGVAATQADLDAIDPLDASLWAV
ncbi:MAG: hypothetical protein OXC29_25240 [Rhodococcus sp.]|nr:hypothetical protein [Rhodococcus sp. (in: high G+C Gram-positive bacteria)]